MRDSVNDVAGMTEDVEEIAILEPQILTQVVERAVDVPWISTDQETVPCRKSPNKLSTVSVQTVDVPVPQVMTQEVLSQVPVPVTTR